MFGMELLFKTQCFPGGELWRNGAYSTKKLIFIRLYCCTFAITAVCFQTIFNTKKHHFQAIDLLLILQSLSLDLCDLGSVMNKMADQSDWRAHLQNNTSTNTILLLSLALLYYAGLIRHMACWTPTEPRYRLILSTSQRVQWIFSLTIHLRDIKTVPAMHRFGGKVGASMDFTWLMV